MATFCLHKDTVDEFLRALKDGRLDPTKLVAMNSEERRATFEPIVGADHAPLVNKEFETKVLTKNIEQTMVTWAKTVAGMKPELRQDLIGKIERMDERILNPADEASFLQDLAAHKLGVKLTFDEVKHVSDLAQKMDELKEFKGSDNRDERLEYGRAVVALNNYINERKLEAMPSLKEAWQHNKASLPKRIITGVAGNAKAIQASMDNSALFRQGWKVLWTHPTVWAANARKSFAHLVTYTNQHQVLDELNADIVSRPTYDLMRKAKLDDGVNEEVFPTTAPEKIPLIGRQYKATENAYTAFVRKTRADVFDRYIKIAQDQGVELTPRELESIGKMVNSLTGRGHLGGLESYSKAVNTFFFSPKNLKSHFDMLTQPLSGAGGSNFVRREAAKNLMKTAAGTAAVLAIAKMIAPNSVTLDPRSSDFGKIKVGDTRFDVTGGMSSVLVLLSRMSAAVAKTSYDQTGGYLGADINSYTNSVTGETRDLTNPKFGQQNAMDVMTDFLENKFSPAMNFVRTFAKGKNFDNKKPTLFAETGKLFIPLPFQTLYEVYTDPEAKKRPGFAALATVMDMLGFATNTYAPTQKGAPKGQYEVSLEDILKASKDYLPK